MQGCWSMVRFTLSDKTLLDSDSPEYFLDKLDAQ